MRPLAPLECDIIDRWQRGFPLVARPYAFMASALDRSEPDIIEALEGLTRDGILSRIGATLKPNTAGASVLVAMQVTPDRLDDVARIVNREPGVNHNYEREHDYNLWFVLTGGNRAAVSSALDRLRAATGLECLELPLERSYHIDLGFPLKAKAGPRHDRAAAAPSDRPLKPGDRAVLEALEPGLALTSRPYAHLGWLSGKTEMDVMMRIDGLVGAGIINRFGLIIRHRPLGYEANAMAVWDIDDGEVDALGASLAREPAVTLCYRRPRRRPHWPYNLFCMVHGRERSAVQAEIAGISERHHLERTPHAVLFSRRCFRQRGATLRATGPGEVPACP